LAHQWHWRSIIEKVYGHRAYYLMVIRDNEVCGVLPLIHVRHALLGSSLTSMPYLDTGGICADDEVATHALLAEARSLRAALGISCVELRHGTPIPELPILPQDKVSMVLDLSPGEQAVWAALPAKVRNQVRKAEKCGLTVHSGGAELINDFYRVFAFNMRDLGSPVHSKAFFEVMADVFGESMEISLIRDQHATVGGLVTIFFKDAAIVPWASCLRESFRKCPNNLLYWHTIQTSCRRKCTSFDFGRSSVGSGTYEFKRQWGARPARLAWQVLDKDRASGSALSSSDSKLRAVVEIWKRLPVPLTTFIGPSIRKYLTN
jgi:FemAB-related protein (PEP-CTERM system-associated)